ncbi:MAG TPA: class I SAM-dependent methyltransferase [Actinomycetota bacterium]|jgi:trans-aconitate methyltransferase|nr:class I SAM-dependent methyltransferase [Actinomycetota bacterium]
MANDRQFKVDTRFVATRGVAEYRRSITQVVRSDDIVLELGCEWGTTTRELAAVAQEVIGTDVSKECICRARQSHPGIRFEVLDAFDVRSALDLGTAFTVVYMDLSGVSGYRSLLDLVALMQMYATVLRPRTIVVKSGALKHFASHCAVWRDPQTSS